MTKTFEEWIFASDVEFGKPLQISDLKNAFEAGRQPEKDLQKKFVGFDEVIANMKRNGATPEHMVSMIEKCLTQVLEKIPDDRIYRFRSSGWHERVERERVKARALNKEGE